MCVIYGDARGVYNIYTRTIRNRPAFSHSQQALTFSLKKKRDGSVSGLLSYIYLDRRAFNYPTNWSKSANFFFFSFRENKRLIYIH